MKFVVIVTIVFIVVAAAYAAPPNSRSETAPTDGAAAAKPITAAKPIAAPATATAADTTADGNTNSHKTFGDVYDTAANFLKRLFNKNWQLFCLRYTKIAVGFISSLDFFTL